MTCSCTNSERYWTSTTFEPVAGYAWDVDFGLGQVSADFKTETLHARAVRGDA